VRIFQPWKGLPRRKERRRLPPPRPRTGFGEGGAVCLLVDRSDSTQNLDMEPSRFGAALKAVEVFNQSRAAAHPDSWLSLCFFAEESLVAVPPRPVGEAFAQALRRLPPQCPAGLTNFSAALLSSLELLPPSRVSRQIVLLTDGGNNSGGTDDEVIDLSRQIRREGILIEAVGIGARDQVNEELLLQMVSTVGGRKLYRWIGETERLIQHYGAIAKR